MPYWLLYTFTALGIAAFIPCIVVLSILAIEEVTDSVRRIRHRPSLNKSMVLVPLPKKLVMRLGRVDSSRLVGPEISDACADVCTTHGLLEVSE
jgi:hypothetical protein